MAALFSYDPPAMDASDDDSCLNCGHHEMDHLMLEEEDLRTAAPEWDGRCLVEGCGCTQYR